MLTAFPVFGLTPGIGNSAVCHIHVLQNGTVGSDHDTEKTVVLVEAADAYFEILVKFFAVIGLGHHGNVPEIQRNSVGAVVLHGAEKLAVAERRGCRQI